MLCTTDRRENGAQFITLTPDNRYYQPTNQASSTRFAAKCHRDADAVCTEIDAFFAEHWPWPKESAREAFLKTDTSRWACWALSLARNDRILHVVEATVLFFLLDGRCFPLLAAIWRYRRLLLVVPIVQDTKANFRSTDIEGMSLEDGKALYDPYEWIIYDVWVKLRAGDEDLAESLLQGALLCVRAQVDEARNQCTGMRALLHQRYKEGGERFVSAAMAYGMDLHLSASEFASIAGIEDSYSKLLITVNDIKSYDKEIRSFKASQAEGGTILNMVQMQVDETGCSVAAAKRNGCSRSQLRGMQ
ncbi:MAG: hypothetical protein Q9207_003646 [Kuettlingeria erythrocarpa]